jgi:hypothetical protein
MNLRNFSLAPVALIGLIGLSLPASAEDGSLFVPIELAQSQGRPQGGPQGGPPPQEAFDACAAIAEGEACAFTLQDDASIEGTCHKPPQGRQGALVCVPNDAPPPKG